MGVKPRASRTGVRAEENAARRSAELGLERGCDEVVKIMRARPYVGAMILKHLEHVGLRELPKGQDKLVAGSNFTNSVDERRQNRRAKDKCVVESSICEFARAGFAPPKDASDMVPSTSRWGTSQSRA